MSSLSNMVERVRSFDPERVLGLRPGWPQVALELDRDELSLVRVKRRRGDRPLLETRLVRPLEPGCIPATIFDTSRNGDEQLRESLREAFEAGETRAGRVALVLPDNLAKISMLNLPERPPTRKQLLEVIRFKMRRAVPFQLSEAALSHQLIPTDGPGLRVLVAAMRRSQVERYEAALEEVGARPGLIDLATPNLLNLCRARIGQLVKSEGDTALLNCAQNYFSLVIVRDGRLIFYRCKTYALGDSGPERPDGLLLREVSSSISYYQEKLGGQGIGTMLVRSVAGPLEEIAESLRWVAVERLEGVNPGVALDLGDRGAMTPEMAQRVAPAAGAAIGR